MKQPRTSSQVREEFFAFFREKQHTIVPSAPLVPQQDPSLLFVSAGMNQFKDVFLGTGERDYLRAADAQKCLRVSGKHNDLEEVGRDTYHHTFFEMLGNWSFGDYFKEEAIAWAWELLTHRWGLDPNRLYATVHAGDSDLGIRPDGEAASHWAKHLPSGRVLYGASKDNFWMMGETGPCGPCSEVHIDLRPQEERQAVSGATLVNRDHPLVIELWNLVFIQFNASADRGLTLLEDRHVDTGMGLERLVAVLQGATSTYDTDLFAPLLERVATLSPLKVIKGYSVIEEPAQKEKMRIAMRVVADHIRAIAFAIADGAAPGNTGRGYVIRRILRRAARYGYQTLGFREPFLYKLIEPLVTLMGAHYGELVEHQRQIEGAIQGEEAAFLRTLGKGMSLFETITPYVKKGAAVATSARDKRAADLLQKAYVSIEEESERTQRFARSAALHNVPGEIAFLLHDTYGFPIDLTQLMAREEGLGVDMGRYVELMAQQQDRAREAGKFGDDPQVMTDRDQQWKEISHGEDSQFLGYDSTTLSAAAIRSVRAEEPHMIVLDKTPFYAEGGGQVGDTGLLRIGDEEISVLDTQARDGRILHIVDRLPSLFDAPVEAVVDAARRERIAKHHTATHLLHAALREVLGKGVAQKGSLVASGHLRFDFSHYERVAPADLERVQERVNDVIQRNIPGRIERDVPYKAAVARGARALFGEKYGDRVRVVTFGEDFSLELCGGTHVDATGEIGLFLLRSEGSVAAGIRRVEAMVGPDALDVVQRQFHELDRVRDHFRGLQRPANESVAHLVSENKRMQKEINQLRQATLAASLDAMIGRAEHVGAVRLVAGRLEDTDMDTLRVIGQQLRDRLGSASVGVLGTAFAGKAYLVATVSDDLVDKGLKAGRLVGLLAGRIGGGGGGRAELATAGGRRPEKLAEALGAASALLGGMLA